MRLALVILPVCLVAEPRAADACSPWPDEYVRTVFPADGAAEVPTNARLTVDYSWIIDPPGLELRLQGGASVAVTVERPAARLVVVPTEYLAPNSTYELLDTLSLDCGDAGPWCYGAAAVIATFTTGTGPDVTRPQLGGVTAGSQFYCFDDCYEADNLEIHEIAIDSRIDDGPLDWIRFEYLDGAGEVVAGPTDSLVAGKSCGGGVGLTLMRYVNVPSTFQIRAVDLAGNRELIPHTIVGDPCGACPTPDAGPGGGVSDGGGCSSHRGATPWLGLFLVLVRRRRCVS